MDKKALRKELETALVKSIEEALHKRNAIAGKKIKKAVLEASKKIAKKFSKAIKELSKAKLSAPAAPVKKSLSAGKATIKKPKPGMSKKKK